MKYINKKIVAGIIVIFLGLGVIFGDETRVGYYIEQATAWLSTATDSDIGETKE